MANLLQAFQSFRSSTPFITFTIAYAIFTDQFLFAAIVPVAPFALERQLHIPSEQVQFWIVILLGVFGIACFLTSIPWGYYSDLHPSRRTPFLIGLCILLSATILLWVAPNLPLQILGRVLQGFASTIVWTTGLAVLVDTVGQKHIGEYMGYVGIALNAGTLVAPLLGGIVFERCGYNAVFGLVAAVVGLDFALRIVMRERPVTTTPATALKSVSETSLDIEAASCTKVAIVDINPADMDLDSKPSTLPALFRLLTQPRFLSTLLATLVLALTFSGFQTVLPLFVHDTFHWTSTGSGLIFLPLTFPALFGPLVGHLTDRFPGSGRYFATTAFLLMALSLVLLRFVEEDSMEHKVLLCALLFLIGSCMALALEPILAEITSGATRLDEEDLAAGMGNGKSSYGQAYALFNMAWAGGNTLGPLWAGLIIEQAGWKTMTWSLGLLSGVTAVPVVLWCGGWLFSRRK